MRIPYFIGTIAFVVLLGGAPLYGQSPEELRAQIEEQQAQIAAIDAEIAAFEAQLQEIGGEKQTLQSAIRELEVSRQKIVASVSAARSKINAAELEITEIGREITDHEAAITVSANALSETLRRLDELESESFVELVLRTEALSEFWDDVESVQQFQLVMRDRIQTLAQIKSDLEGARVRSEEKREVLIYQRDNLTAQQWALEINKREHDSLLRETEAEEANYQALLDEKVAARQAFEAALQDLESQLEYTLDPSLIPPSGEGILRWPLETVTITQYFGDTAFAQSGAYNGRGHNGVDFRASVGTPVRSALSGIVQAAGNTDQHPGCYSYGKWMLLRHNNGLTTLYAHLSDFAVSQGQQVATGEIIGYSGNTGYSTGPHLHFSVYQSDAVQIVRLGDIKRRTNCANAQIPVAPLRAYLNPLNYL